MVEGCYELRLLPYGEDPRNLLDSEFGVRSRGEPRDGWRHQGFLSSFHAGGTGASLAKRFAGHLHRGDIVRLGYSLLGKELSRGPGFVYWVAYDESTLGPLHGQMELAAGAYEALDLGGMFQATVKLVGNRKTCRVLLRLLGEVFAVGAGQALRGVVQQALAALSLDEPDHILTALGTLRAGLTRAEPPHPRGVVLVEEEWLAWDALGEVLQNLENALASWEVVRDLRFPPSLVAYHSLVRTGAVIAQLSRQWAPALGRRVTRGEAVPRGVFFDAPAEVFEDLAERLVRLYPLGDLVLFMWGGRDGPARNVRG